MTVNLSNDMIELLYFCLEQMESGFNPDEQKLCDQMIAKFHTAQTTI
tara:strand:- start:340 stop:480 length:141 start_codon:yes stop_codon:yes gene_type:complete